LAQQNQTIADTLDTLPQALNVLREDRSKLTTLLTSLSHLGSVASNIIVATQTSLTSALRDLSPALEQLSAAGSDLPHALRVAGTFPFPLGTTLQAVKGDYANLHLFLDLTLTNELCGINKLLCVATGSAGGGLTGLGGVLPSATTKTNTTSSVSNPMLVGLGG